MPEAAKLDELLQLPRDERARFAKALVESLDDALEEGCEDAWVEELEKRALEARDNPEALADWSVVRRRLKARLQNNNK